MSIDENDHIDVREWLPQAFAKEYPHRARQLGFSPDHHTLRADESILPIDTLLERGTITGAQHKAAMIVRGVRRSINNSLGLDRLFELRLPPEEVAAVSATPPSMFLASLLLGLNQWELNIIDRITALPRGEYDRESRPVTNQDVAWLSHCCASVKAALDKITANMKIIVDERKKNCKSDNTQSAITTS